MAAKKKSVLNTFSSSDTLLRSIENGKSEFTIEALLKEGADIEYKDWEGNTILLLACGLGQKNNVELLLNYGANINCREPICNMTVLHFASMCGWTGIVQSLVKRGMDIDARDYDRRTPLHMASFNGHVEIVKCLVVEGADLEVENYLGATPLMFAAMNGSRGVFNLLLNAGANVFVSNFKKRTVLYYVTREEWMEEIQSVVRRRVDLNTRDIEGQTALLLSCKLKNVDIAEYLFQAGARCDIADKDGNSPLHYLIKMERPSVKLIKLFIKNVPNLLPADYNAMLNSFLLKSDILQNVEFCCQAIVSKFNNYNLLQLYELPMTKSLPPIEKMKMVICSEVFRKMERTVKFEIQTKGHCNLFEVHSKMLNVLCVKSLSEYYAKKNQNCKIG